MGSTSIPDLAMEGFVLGEVVPEDIEQLARLQAMALSTDPFFSIAMKDVTQENFDAFVLQLLHARLEYPKATTYKITAPATEKITEEELARPKTRPTLPKGCAPELGDFLLQEISTMRTKNGFNPEKDYCGMALGTLPEYQGKGFAKKLVQMAINLQDRDQRMYYATVRPAAWKLYESLGFEDFKVLEIDLRP